MTDLRDRTRFEPAEVEPRIVAAWLASELFWPAPDGDPSENYSIAIPPPNVTGALLPLLNADIDTLAGADRATRLRLLAFPHGRSKARIYDRDLVRSRLTARQWTLTFQQTRARRVDIEAVLPWRACGRGARVRAGLTTLRTRMRSGRITLHRCP